MIHSYFQIYVKFSEQLGGCLGVKLGGAVHGIEQLPVPLVSCKPPHTFQPTASYMCHPPYRGTSPIEKTRGPPYDPRQNPRGVRFFMSEVTLYSFQHFQ